MIWLLRPDQPKPTEFAPAMTEGTGILPGLPAVRGKPVHVAFDGGLMTSDAGILLLAAIEQRLNIAERLAACIEDPRDPERVRHELAEMIRYRALLIAAGYPDGNDCTALRSDPAFKMAVGRLPESGEDLCSQPTISRLENLPGATALKRMMAAMGPEAAAAAWDVVIDSCSVRAKRGGELTGPNPTDRAKRGTKYHVVVASDGLPIAALPSAANVNDTMLFPALLRRALVVCTAIARLYADAGYDSAENHRLCAAEGILPLIRERGDPHGSGLGPVRCIVEHANAWLLANKRLDRRNDRLTSIIDALLTAACILSSPTGSRINENRA